MKKLRTIPYYLLAFLIVGSVSFLFSPTAYANEIDDIYNSEKTRLQAKGITVPWNTVGEFQNQIVGPCKSKAPSSTTSADCARLAMSCLETVTTQSRCSEPDSLAKASDGGISIGNTLGGDCQGAGLGKDNKCFTLWNQQAKQDRWNKSYEQHIKDLCSANAKNLSQTQAENCEDEGKKAFEACYAKIAKDDPRVPDEKLTSCFNEEFKKTTSIDASNPSTPGNSSTTDPANGGAANSSQKSVCAIQKIGWLVCPVTEFVANLADKVYAGVAGFMEVRAFSATSDAFDSSSPLMKAWIQMRDLANILFVVAFLIIIYSQITGAGVSNYGIKRMLPRLIIGAILVNASFYICAIAVDISNILGYALKEMITSMKPDEILIDSDKINDFAMWSNAATAILAGGAIAGGAIVIGTAAGGMLATALGALIPLLLAAIFAVIVAFLILLARQAVIILLIVISPLAFVAYLLPNTESLFDKWRKLFITLLMMFPLIALLFGGSQLAAYILQQAGVTMAGTSDVQGKIIGLFLWLGGIGVLFIPLGMTPFLIKISGNVGRFAGMVNNKNKGILDRTGKYAEGKIGDMSMRHQIKASSNEGIRYAGARRTMRNRAVTDSLKANANKAYLAHTATEASANGGDNRFARQLAGGSAATAASINQVQANARAALDKLNADEVHAARLSIEHLDYGDTQARLPGAGPVTSATAEQQAAIQKTVETMDIKGIDELLKNSSKWGNSESARTLQKTLADALSKSRPAYVGQGDIAAIRTGANGDGESMRLNAISKGAYSMEKIAGADPDELEAMYATAQSRAGSMTPGRRTFIDNAKNVQGHATLGAKIGKNADVVRRIGNL